MENFHRSCLLAFTNVLSLNTVTPTTSLCTDAVIACLAPFRNGRAANYLSGLASPDFRLRNAQRPGNALAVSRVGLQAVADVAQLDFGRRSLDLVRDNPMPGRGCAV